MDAANNSAESLREQIKETEEQLKNLKIQLQELESRAAETPSHDSHPASSKWPLSPEEYKRYGRQMIAPNVGIQGQLRLKSASVLIIGVGGLGCPAAAYLAGAGVGTLGLVDGDVLEISNLHRQILHSTTKIGMKKVDSAIEYLKTLNPTIKYIPHPSHINPQTASSIVQNYDLVLDCTDHPTSRYLISDICILHSKPLISASALRTDGQLLLLNHPALLPGNPGGGPCYRCVFPKPPPAESVVSCGDGGILGPVVGVMGVLQSLEALKLITSGNLHSMESQAGATMLLFSSSSTPPFRQVRLRSTRRPNCFACSGSPSPTNPSTSILTLDSLNNGTLNYAQFCGLTSPVTLLTPSERITASQYHTDLSRKPHILVDVREKIQFDICSLPGSVNVPFSSLGSLALKGKEGKSMGLNWLGGGNEEVDGVGGDDGRPIYVVCRLGNDSQIAVRKFKELGIGRGKGAENGDGDGNDGRYIGDLKDGLKAWKRDVDESWPEY